MGEIIQFKAKEHTEPEAKVIGHRISFYTEEELDITLMSLNVYGIQMILAFLNSRISTNHIKRLKF